MIACNEPEVRAVFSKENVTDPNLFPVQWRLALSHLLASELAIPLLGVKEGRPMKQDELAIYDQYITNATANDLNEQYSPQPDSEYISVRA